MRITPYNPEESEQPAQPVQKQPEQPSFVMGSFGPIISHTFEGQMQPLDHPELGQYVQQLQTEYKNVSGFFSIDGTNGMLLYKAGPLVEAVMNPAVVPEGSKIISLAQTKSKPGSQA